MVFRRIAGLKCPNCRALAPSGIFQTLRWRGVHPPNRLSVACTQCGAVLRLKQKTAARLGLALLALPVLMGVVFLAALALAQLDALTILNEDGQKELGFWGGVILMLIFILTSLQVYRIYNVEEVPV